MPTSAIYGGIPELTAVLVIVTGVLGVLIGDALLYVARPKSAVARGAMWGMGAHGIGIARARELGGEDGAIAALVMILAGLLNVVCAPLLAAVL